LSYQSAIHAPLTQTLEDALIEDVIEYVAPQNHPWIKGLWKTLLRPAVRRFCALAAAFDHTVASIGFCRAAAHWLPYLVPSYQVVGAEHIPNQGPLLILANHPGTFDLVLLAACLPRDDFKTIASDRPFFRALTATSAYLIFSSRVDLRAKANVIRHAIQHLEDGGVLVLFPAGRLEPDPSHQPTAALQALRQWSESTQILISRVPHAYIQVAMMGGLVSPHFMRHPVVKWQKSAYNALVTAEVLQIWRQFRVNKPTLIAPRIHFGLPQKACDLASLYADPLAGINHQAMGLIHALINS
ncbi:MAG: 1-acyl-sn-glycerol-3-phosphate acyltransferase, partial [Thermanaerothrix sp.]|nr:1-acyl-sn-glycerol-3-phosphate acyltransferase [Thermanaerothrix sp.]